MKIFLLLSFLLLLPSCGSPAQSIVTPTVEPTISRIADQNRMTETTTVEDHSPTAREYNLGETTIVQSRFAEDNRFRKMPVRLNGVVAAPPDKDGPYPVVVICHGTYPGCPDDGTGVDRWPCDPEVEQPNYQGFTYLVEALAAEGYVALTPNFNAENTFGFGEGTPGERLSQLVNLHLQALVLAAAGGSNDFGVDLDGQADLSRMAFIGHSRVPQVVILPICDGDVMDQEGSFFMKAPGWTPNRSNGCSPSGWRRLTTMLLMKF